MLVDQLRSRTADISRGRSPPTACRG